MTDRSSSPETQPRQPGGFIQTPEGHPEGRLEKGADLAPAPTPKTGKEIQTQLGWIFFSKTSEVKNHTKKKRQTRQTNAALHLLVGLGHLLQQRLEERADDEVRGGDARGADGAGPAPHPALR